jgi:bacterioferritin-associated ferredoxin
MNDISPEQKMSNLLKLIGNPSQCKGCQAPMWWVVTKAGKAMPLNSDGVPHWATCPNVRDFKIKKAAERRGF